MRRSVTCSSDTGVVERIEWQREGQVVVEATSVQQLELVLDPVSDTDHGATVTCVVTRSEQDRSFNQSLMLSVTGKSIFCVMIYFSMYYSSPSSSPHQCCCFWSTSGRVRVQYGLYCV